MTLTPGSYEVSAAFPTGFAVKNIIIVTDNSSFNTLHLLQHSYIFQTTTVTITGSGGGSAKLNTLYSYLGTFTNSSSVSAFGDKAVHGGLENVTLYANSINNLGQATEYDMLTMFATPGTYVPLWAASLASVSINKTQALTFAMTMYLSYPFTFNLAQIEAYVIFTVIGISLVITMFYTYPRTSGSMSSSERRAHNYAFRQREIGYFIGAVIVAGLEFIVIGAMGGQLPQYFGIGGAIAAFLGLALGTYLYSMSRTIGRYDANLAIGIIASFAFVIVNAFLFFGQDFYAMTTYKLFTAEVAVVLVLVAGVIMLFESFFATKRADLV